MFKKFLSLILAGVILFSGGAVAFAETDSEVLSESSDNTEMLSDSINNTTEPDATENTNGTKYLTETELEEKLRKICENYNYTEPHSGKYKNFSSSNVSLSALLSRLYYFTCKDKPTDDDLIYCYTYGIIDDNILEKLSRLDTTLKISSEIYEDIFANLENKLSICLSNYTPTLKTSAHSRYNIKLLSNSNHTLTVKTKSEDDIITYKAVAKINQYLLLREKPPMPDNGAILQKDTCAIEDFEILISKLDENVDIPENVDCLYLCNGKVFSSQEELQEYKTALDTQDNTNDDIQVSLLDIFQFYIYDKNNNSDDSVSNISYKLSLPEVSDRSDLYYYACLYISENKRLWHCTDSSGNYKWCSQDNDEYKKTGFYDEYIYNICYDNVFFVPQWDQINFDSNGGTGDMPNMLVDFKKGVNLPSCVFTKEECKFDGWNIYDDFIKKWYCTDGTNYKWISNESSVYKKVIIFDSQNDVIINNTQNHHITFKACWSTSPSCFEIDNNGIITNYTGSYTEIKIPSIIDDIKVAGIKSQIFFKNIDIKTAYISCNVSDSAFAKCANLEKVFISDGVNKIDTAAFAMDTSLKEIYIPDSVTDISTTAFKSCSDALKIYCNTGSYAESFAKKNNIKYISYTDTRYFTYKEKDNGIEITKYDEKAPTNVHIPNTINDLKITSILPNAFGSNVENIEIDSDNNYYETHDGVLFTKDMKTLVRYPRGKKDSEYIIPLSVTGIGNDAFYYCTSLTSITISDSVTSISDWAFSGCTSLTSINIPDSVTSISGYAFRNCTSLTSINIPDSVTSISIDAFKNCTGLTSITIPDSVTSIGYCTFYNCTSLTSLTIPDSVTSISDLAFRNCTNLIIHCYENSYAASYAKRNSINCISYTHPKYLEISANIIKCVNKNIESLLTQPQVNDTKITTIAESASWYNTDLKKVILHEGITTIEDDAFYGCDNLEYVIMPQSIESIGNGVFDECPKLILYVYKGTVAEQYAKDNGISYKCFATSDDFDYDEEILPDNSRNITLTKCKNTENEHLSLYTINNNRIVSIADETFSDCKQLKSIVIPSSVISISGTAFKNCQSDLIIYCQSDSYAERYAKSHSITYEIIP